MANKQRFFEKDPEISWYKVLCPMCKEPTGPKSKCEQIRPPKDGTIVKHKTMGMLPVYGENCVFKQNNMWQANLNYPASAPLLKHLSKIAGIEKLMAVGNYSVQFTFAKLFDEAQVKTQINQTYKVFVKEIAVKESELRPKSEAFASQTITFKNGKEYKTTTQKENVLANELLDQLSQHCNLKKKS